MNLHTFTGQKNMNFNNVHDFVRYLFWHWFMMILGYRFRLQFETILMIFLCFVTIEFLKFWGMVLFQILRDFWSENGCQNVHRRSSRIRPPSPIFLHTCESYQRKTHKCVVKGFLDFKITIKVFLHNGEYCLSKTYKFAVTRNQNSWSSRSFGFW